MNTTTSASPKQVFLTVLVASLGYFVDIFDLILFSVLRIKSLKDFGLDDAQIKIVGENLLSHQMWGMLVGGILWGILGDKRGRMWVLFGSIILYSLGNIANGFVQTVWQYELARFISGIGLAGELGAGITLVSEIMSKEKRGFGTTIVATVGVLGAVLAYFISTVFDWRTCYFIGGGMGLALLLLRVGVSDSGMFSQVKGSTTKRGEFHRLLLEPKLLFRFVASSLVGVTAWFMIGILVTFSKEFAVKFGLTEVPNVGLGVMWCYVGLTLGDLTSGLLSQLLKSRRKVLILFHSMSFLTMGFYISTTGGTLDMLYFKMALIGFSGGFWAVFVSTSAEQFGTNLRATVATSAPNITRGLFPLILLSFRGLETQLGMITAAWILCAILPSIAIVAVWYLPETFGKDLDYTE
jgi:MFS transporter, putative metabolite:H+ symporter